MPSPLAASAAPHPHERPAGSADGLRPLARAFLLLVAVVVAACGVVAWSAGTAGAAPAFGDDGRAPSHGPRSGDAPSGGDTGGGAHAGGGGYGPIAGDGHGGRGDRRGSTDAVAPSTERPGDPGQGGPGPSDLGPGEIDRDGDRALEQQLPGTDSLPHSPASERGGTPGTPPEPSAPTQPSPPTGPSPSPAPAPPERPAAVSPVAPVVEISDTAMTVARTPDRHVANPPVPGEPAPLDRRVPNDRDRLQPNTTVAPTLVPAVLGAPIGEPEFCAWDWPDLTQPPRLPVFYVSNRVPG